MERTESNGLYWEKIDIMKQLEMIMEVIESTRKETPAENTRTLDKTNRWSEHLNEII